MDITKIKIGNSLYSVKDANATTSLDVTKLINQELYGSDNKPENVSIVTSQNITNILLNSGVDTADTKNTTGASNKTGTKMFLVGSASLGTNPVTYSNSGCYIGTDNCIYSNGSKAINATDVTNAVYTELYGSTTKPSGAYTVTSQNITTAISDAGISTGGASTYAQVGYTVSKINGSQSLTIPGTAPLYLVTVSQNISSVKLTNNPGYGHSCHVIFKSANSSSYTVTIGNHATNRICPTSAGMVLTVPASGTGYVEVDFLNMGNSTDGDEVYVRGV